VSKSLGTQHAGNQKAQICIGVTALGKQEIGNLLQQEQLQQLQRCCFDRLEPQSDM